MHPNVTAAAPVDHTARCAFENASGFFIHNNNTFGILREENNGKPFNFLQEIEEILFSFNLWDDWDVLDCPRKIYYGIIKDKEIFRQLLNKYYWKPTPVINANPRYK